MRIKTGNKRPAELERQQPMSLENKDTVPLFQKREREREREGGREREREREGGKNLKTNQQIMRQKLVGVFFLNFSILPTPQSHLRTNHTFRMLLYRFQTQVVK